MNRSCILELGTTPSPLANILSGETSNPYFCNIYEVNADFNIFSDSAPPPAALLPKSASNAALGSWPTIFPRPGNFFNFARNSVILDATSPAAVPPGLFKIVPIAAVVREFILSSPQDTLLLSCALFGIGNIILAPISSFVNLPLVGPLVSISVIFAPPENISSVGGLYIISVICSVSCLFEIISIGYVNTCFPAVAGLFIGVYWGFGFNPPENKSNIFPCPGGFESIGIAPAIPGDVPTAEFCTPGLAV